jgi:DNA-binding MarR family transcriptional regulator
MEDGDSEEQAGRAVSIARMTPALSQFIENMGLHYEGYGLPRIGGRIIGMLLVSPGPVSSEEMAEALQVARSSISTNLKTLLMSELVEKVSLPGERVDYYVLSDDCWQKALELRLAGMLDLQELGADGLRCLEPGHPARERLVEMIEWVDQLRVMLEKLTAEWQARKQPIP